MQSLQFKPHTPLQCQLGDHPSHDLYGKTQNVTTKLCSPYLRRREEGRGQGKEERNVERVVEAAEGEGGEEPMEMS